jgi:hypothetical protein
MGYDIMQSYRWHQCLERICWFYPHITSNMKTEVVRFPMSDISPAKLSYMPEDQNLNFNRCEIMLNYYAFVTIVVQRGTDA